MNLRELKDEELLSQFSQSRDTRLLGELFLRHRLMVFGVCLKYLRYQEQAEDAVMNLFEKLIELEIKTEVVQVRPWLYTLAKNQCLMELRKQVPGIQSLDDELFFDAFMESGNALHPMDERTQKEEQLQKMEKELLELNLQQQTCLKQFYLEGKSYEQIAKLNRMSLNEVKSHVQNGKRNLRIRLQESGNGWLLVFWLWISSNA